MISCDDRGGEKRAMLLVSMLEPPTCGVVFTEKSPMLTMHSSPHSDTSSAQPQAARGRARSVSAHLFAVCVLAALMSACAVDTDTLVCAPGHTRRGEQCVDVEAKDTTRSGCASWADCGETEYCGETGPDGFGVCLTRCDVDNHCDDAEYCSVSGLCLVAGEVMRGSPCDATARCREGSLCELSRQICVESCDPRAAAGCVGGECQANAAGLGVCITP